MGEGRGRDARIQRLQPPTCTPPHTHTAPPHAHPHPLTHTQRAADGVLLHRGLQSPGAFQAQPESPGSKFGMGNPDPISSARTHVPPSSLLACSHGREGTASVLSPCDALISGRWAAYGRETSRAPKPGDSQGVGGSGREKSLPNQLLSPDNLVLRDFPHQSPQQPAAALLLTVSPCPGDAGSLWMLPWKGPQEKPSGRLLRVRTRLSPSCTARSSSPAGRDRHSISTMPSQPDPWPMAAPGPWGRGHPLGAESCRGVPRGCVSMVSGWVGSGRLLAGGVRARHGGSGHGGRAEGAFPIPAPKVTAASGLNGFDYLISLWFNGLDNMLIRYEGCSKMF